ncbi:MAG: ATP-binding cassette domain-containing protein [Bacteroidota bacterium]
MIQIHELYKSFPSQAVLENISVELMEGRHCILGKSGSGKSVLLKIILGLEMPDAGKVYLMKKDQARFTDDDWLAFRNKIGVVFQGSALFDSLTIFENVGIKLLEEKGISTGKIKEKVIHCLESVGLSKDILPAYPSSLSGGMRKRVAIARAIIHQPEILFYDEPTAGLDPVSASQIDELMLSLSSDTVHTHVIITHDLTTVRKLATHVHMLGNKGLLYSGGVDGFFRATHPDIQSFLTRE